ncbi:hypothetical protein ISN45_Aa05g003250 [Arabidopsis thaliana x Arabidopsis arenosa]|uniref:Defensin-like protein n=2 Tax=Arabidopsis TaxID=3701 RepID=A0A8T1ZUE0_ARASU|nr:hypothetical protein ISN45_Aa05g003250 [Arabidopsis thaliana x Arabidopsis arenosa]KAG7563489.1 hypothetical protein ISN44_As10g002900 [Arabidopsis suecica]
MASKITIFFLLALVIACTMMVRIPTANAEVFLPCKTTDDCENLSCSGDECEYLPCSGRPALCIKGQCKCTVSLTHQAKLDNLRKMNDAKTCKQTSDCDPRMRYSCVSGSYICLNGFCTCT